MRSLLLGSFVVLSASAASAQVVPLGPAFQINTYTTDNQTAASVATDAGGDFVVAWQSNGQDGSGYGIFGRRYDSTGAPRGPEFQANTYTTGDQERRAAVASDGAGNFTVVWGNRRDHFDYEVMGQRYDASGSRIGGEFQVNTTTTGWQYEPSIASDALGNFVVVWHSYSSYVSTPRALFGQRYASTGMPVGGEFRIDSYPATAQVLPAVAVHEAGGSVVAWKSSDGSGNHDGTYARSYDRTGAAGAEVQVNSCLFPQGGRFGRPAVASLGAGAFVVAWPRWLAGGIVHRVEAQVFDANGFVAGREIAVSSVGAQPLLVSLVAEAPDRFTVFWHPDDQSGTIWGRSFNTAGVPTSAQFEVGQISGSRNVATAATQAPGTFVVTWTGYNAPAASEDIFGRMFGGLGTELEQRDLGLDPTGNRVLENGEIGALVPGWSNPTAAPIAASGTLTGFTGPSGATYTIVDGAAEYGLIAPGQRGDCAAAADCYSLTVSASSRPTQHWDAAVDETLSTGTTRTWRIHIGDSFADVPRTRRDYAFVEGLLHHGVTAGCASGLYCPDSPISRGEMAVYLRVAREGGEMPNVSAPGVAVPCLPNNCVGSPQMFADVPVLHTFCRWISELAQYAVVNGCGGGNYCPDAPVSREQMAVFVLATREGPAYAPPACVAGSERFADVPAASPYCRWIEELARRDVVTGCGGGLYCPTASVTRGDMSVFVTVTFGLPLYGP